MGRNLYGSDVYLMPPVQLNDYQTSNHTGARWSRYRQYLDFYRGNQWNEPRRPGERRLTVNYARAIIQKSASYLMGKPVSFELIPNGEGPEAEAEASRAERALREMWDDNGLALLDYDTAVDAAVLGDAAFKVTLQPSEITDLSIVNRQSQIVNRVVVRAVDVCNLDAGYKHSDLRELTWVTEQYALTVGEVRAEYGRERVNRAGLAAFADETEVAVEERWTAQNYSVTANDFPIIEEANPYGFIPYIIFPNRAVPRCAWGESDLEDVMGLASELNVRVSVLSQLLQMSGNPVLVLENVEDSDGLRVGPGAVWHLPEGAHAHLLEMLKDGAVNLHTQYIELVYRMLHDLSEAPSAGFGRDGAGSVHSGVALDLMLHPVVQRVQRKRRIWDEVLDRRNRMMLKLAGLPVHRSRIIWPDVLPKDKAAAVTQSVGLVASSIWSLDTARKYLGNEQPDKENELILAEREKLGMQPKAGERGSGPGGSFDQPPVKLSGALVQGLSNSAG